MKATFMNQHGGPEVLQYGDLPAPRPGPNEVLVRLHNAALNHVDITVRKGWKGLQLEFPFLPGCDGAGEVAEVGEAVAGFDSGDRVVIYPNLSCGECEYCIAGDDHMCRHWELLGETVPGTYCEFIALPGKNLLKIPDGFGYAEASAAALVYLTAWHSLISKGRLQAGETVLIVGASGGVNTASLQVAKLAGATVMVVGSDPEKLALADRLGADVLFNRADEPNWSKSVYLATNKRGVDVVVDNVGAGTIPSSLRSVRKGGRILTVGSTGGPTYEIDHRYLFAKHISVLGSTMGPRRDFDTVMSLVFEGQLAPVVDRIFPLNEAQEAHEVLESGNQLGKLVLEI